jgi:predicted metal-dependent hydrolase
MRSTRATKVLTGAQGKYFDLVECLETVNSKYFNGKLPKFDLTWSKGKSKWRHGYYDSDLKTIVVSKSLDKKATPRVVIEYILYHEILHWQFPTKYINGRLNVHSKEYKAAEKAFEEFDQVKNWLKNGNKG